MSVNERVTKATAANDCREKARNIFFFLYIHIHIHFYQFTINIFEKDIALQKKLSILSFFLIRISEVLAVNGTSRNHRRQGSVYEVTRAFRQEQ